MRRYLNLGFLAIFLMLCMISFYALWSGERVRKIFIDMKNDIVPSAMLMSKMKSETFKTSHLLMDYIIHGDDENKEAIEVSLNELKKYGEEHLKYESDIGLEEKREAVELVAKIENLESVVTEIMMLKEQGMNLDKMVDEVEKRVHPAIKILVRQIERRKKEYMQKLALAESQSLNQQNQVVKVVLLLSILFTLTALSVWLLVMKQFSRYIRERNLALDRLGAEKERLAVTLRSIGDGVIATDTDGKVVLINKIAEQLTGWSQEEAVGKSINEVFHIINEKTGEPCENPVEKVLKTNRITDLANHTALISRDGTKRSIADSGSPIRDKDGQVVGVVLVFRDITDQKKMREQMFRSQKLESIALLAGGIAHDFNNILTALMGNISLAKSQLGIDGKVYELLTSTENASRRASQLTQQLLTFAKGGEPVKETATLATLIKDSANFVLAGSNVKCSFDIPKDLWTVDIDSGQISQVIQNIVLNAKHAMPAGGTINITCENFINDSRTIPSLPPGNFVKITIQDHGIGIPEKYLDKIFDPYFTTKESGSGLGLAVCYSIIQKHDGYIMVESTPGVGTTFTIYLPASQKKMSPRSDDEQLLSGKGKILIMDDEELVREVSKEIFSSLGYEVEVAKDGDEMIELYQKAKRDGKPFDVVIMDLTIPGGMGGKEAIRKLLEIDPQAKAIVSSGYSNDSVMANYSEYGFKACLVKPYKLEEVSQKLRQLID